MHDGSIATLTEVLDHYAAGGRTLSGRPARGRRPPTRTRASSCTASTLTAEERADLLAFLESLTDESFLTDPRFADPWPQQWSTMPCWCTTPLAARQASMISFSRISKQYGRQVLFVDASFQLNPGEKVGLVGPNGAGKTTLFRMIVGEEAADEGDVSVPKKLTDRLLPPGRRGDVGPLGARRGDRRQRPRRRPAPRARGAAARDGRSGAGRRHGPRSSRASARCRRSTSTSAATRSRRRRARCSTASASTTSGSTATSARCRAAGRCAWRWRACCSAGPTSC